MRKYRYILYFTFTFIFTKARWQTNHQQRGKSFLLKDGVLGGSAAASLYHAYGLATRLAS